jgi:A1 cistron-splicing factor AAR2
MLEDGEEIEVEMGELEAEDERGEYAPEVVELDERGNQRGLVSWSD